MAKTIVALSDISFANNEIVCLESGEHFLPTQVQIVEDLESTEDLIEKAAALGILVEDTDGTLVPIKTYYGK